MKPLNPTYVQILLSRNLKKIRTSRKITQMHLAELCALSTSFIGEIEICRKFPSAQTLQRIADALEVPPSLLFYDKDLIEYQIKLFPRNLGIVVDLRKKIIKEIDEAMHRIQDL